MLLQMSPTLLNQLKVELEQALQKDFRLKDVLYYILVVQYNFPVLFLSLALWKSEGFYYFLYLIFAMSFDVFKMLLTL